MLLYGKTEQGYAEDMGVSVQEAEETFKTYFKAMPKFKQIIDLF